jgi:PAS domain S-box-containing protein
MEIDLGRVLEGLPALVWTALPDGHVDFLNQRWREYTGLGVPEACGCGWQTAVHPEDLPELLERCRSILASCEPGEIEARLRRFDGAYRRFLLRTAPLADASGHIIKWCGMYVDIEDRKQALGYAPRERTQRDAALRRSQDFLAETRRLSLTGGFSKRVATGEIVWSDEVYRIFEFDPTVPLTLERILTRVHPEDVPSFDEMIARQQRGTDYEHEYRLLMPDKSVKYVHVVAHATRDQGGQLEYIAAIQDVTQRQLSEEALARARAELAHVARASSLGALTASIAHEVNQPLSGIITNASTCLRMLAAHPPNVDGARETARRTIRDGNRASEVITRLRALFTKKSTTTEPVDLNEATREVIALLRSELQRNRVVLRTELEDDLSSVISDRVQLQQVILNLVRNGSDAMSSVDDRPRTLLIKTERDEDQHVRLRVQDAGVGFAPQDAERLFQAFYTTKADGMGIGLSVSRSIIESHHGRLWAEPNNGPGATFSFSIPLRPEAAKDGYVPGAVWTPGVTDTQHIIRNS